MAERSRFNLFYLIANDQFASSLLFQFVLFYVIYKKHRKVFDCSRDWKQSEPFDFVEQVNENEKKTCQITFVKKNPLVFLLVSTYK